MLCDMCRMREGTMVPPRTAMDFQKNLCISASSALTATCNNSPHILPDLLLAFRIVKLFLSSLYILPGYRRPSPFYFSEELEVVTRQQGWPLELQGRGREGEEGHALWHIKHGVC